MNKNSKLILVCLIFTLIIICSAVIYFGIKEYNIDQKITVTKITIN